MERSCLRALNAEFTSLTVHSAERTITTNFKLEAKSRPAYPPGEGGNVSYPGEKPFDEKDFPTLQLIKKDYGFIPNFFRSQTACPDILDAEGADCSRSHRR